MVSATTLLAGYTDADGDTLSVTGVQASILTPTTQNIVTFSNGDGTYGIVAPPNYNGVVNISYSVSDGRGGLVAATQSFTITAVNDAPFLMTVHAKIPNTLVNTNVTVSTADLLFGYTDVEGDAMSVSGLTADHGSVVANGDGTYTITPTFNYTGVVGLSYTVSDGHGGNTAATEQFNVASVVNNPQLTGAPAVLSTGARNTPYKVNTTQLLQGYTEVGNPNLFVGTNVTTNIGTIVYNNDYTYTITPPTDFVGTITLTYLVTDGQGDITTAHQNFVVGIQDPVVNDAPIFDGTAGGNLSIDIGGGYDYLEKTIVQPDGKILLVGYSENPNSGGLDFSVVRLNGDGTLDTSFNGDGKQIIDVGGDDLAIDAVVKSDGTIVITGNSTIGDGLRDFSTVTLNPDGSVISRSLTPVGKFDQGGDVVMQTDGKIVIAGWSDVAPLGEITISPSCA